MVSVYKKVVLRKPPKAFHNNSRIYNNNNNNNNNNIVNGSVAGHGSLVVYCLRSLGSRDRGFESHSGH
jgi:hypothetical protein